MGSNSNSQGGQRGDALAAFLDRHPWPASMLASGAEPLEFLWRFEVEAPVAKLWPLLIDTSRFNRALGLGEMIYEEREGLLHGEAVNGGFRQVWVEHPWQWVYGRFMAAVREYSKGFGRWVRAIYEFGEPLDGLDGGFELWVYFGWIPRGLLGRTMLKLGFPGLEKDYRALLDELVGSLATTSAARPSAYQLTLSGGLEPAAETQLGERATELVELGMEPELVAKLVDHIRSADELELARIQPKVLARAWQVEPRALLRLVLHATRVGLLDLSWDIVCPHCRGTREEHGSLSRVPGDSFCEACDIEFDTGEQTSVEVTFRVNPAIRRVQQRFWCAAEPAQREHIKVQLRLEPGERRRVEPRLDREADLGLYRLRARGVEGQALLELRDDGDEGDDAALAWTPELEGQHQRGPAPILELHNPGDAALDFVLERASWSDEALRPGDLLSLREFRDLFSEDYLSADVQLAVGMQTLLFTDMVGSTRFYASRGDADAFVQVRKHFGEIFEIVGEHDGVVVKTIGDAVMAAFVDAASAIRASHAIQRRFPAGREDLDIRVRISLNRGPCIAVRFNTQIDYFGNAVNLAAKLQGSAGAGQVAFSRAVAEAPGVCEAIEDIGVELELLAADVPALGGEIEVFRWTVDGLDPADSLTVSGPRDPSARRVVLGSGVTAIPKGFAEGLDSST